MRVFYRLGSHELGAVAAEAAWAESMGYDGVSSNETAHDPFLPLAIAATATSRVTLETKVAIAFPRSPMVVASTSRDLQDLSHGRFRLGLGTQVKGHIERRFSTHWESPGPRLREYVQALRCIWDCWANGTKLDFQGRHYQFSLMTPFFDPGPSLYRNPEVSTAAVNAYNCRVAGEVSDGLMLHSLTSAEYVRQVVRPGLTQGANKAGKDPAAISVSGGGFIVTGPNASSIREAQAEVRRRIAFYASTRTYFPVLETHGFQQIGQQLHQMSLRGQWAEMAELVSDEMLDVFSVSGEYDEIAGKFLQRYGGLLDEVNFAVSTSSPPEEAQIRKIIRQLQDSPVD
ncbi:MAG: LLM class F420-dependent oxidoreductase [SAR202 cluster bacterium Io17-Chloro-G7]|nr:MAG: LLM class F420-dependent oxidoreductase [SAR202 cluster bacterium Io17-Chloro-G7]